MLACLLACLLPPLRLFAASDRAVAPTDLAASPSVSRNRLLYTVRSSVGMMTSCCTWALLVYSLGAMVAPARHALAQALELCGELCIVACDAAGLPGQRASGSSRRRGCVLACSRSRPCCSVVSVAILSACVLVSSESAAAEKEGALTRCQLKRACAASGLAYNQKTSGPSRCGWAALQPGNAATPAPTAAAPVSRGRPDSVPGSGENPIIMGYSLTTNPRDKRTPRSSSYCTTSPKPGVHAGPLIARRLTPPTTAPPPRPAARHQTPPR
jgi:hypothetical protein